MPIKVAIINNGNLGMVRQWQTLFYGERYSNTDLAPTAAHPDFVKLAGPTLRRIALRAGSRRRRRDPPGRAINDRPVVIDFIVGADAHGVADGAAGTGNDEIMAARDIRPLGTARSDNSGAPMPFPPGPSRTGRPHHTHLSVLVENKPGVLPRRGAVLPARLQHPVTGGRAGPSTRTCPG